MGTTYSMAAYMDSNVMWYESFHGIIPWEFPNGGRAALEARISALRTGDDDEFIEREQAVVRNTLMRRHEQDMDKLYDMYFTMYGECCRYLDVPVTGRKITNEDALARVRDKIARIKYVNYGMSSHIGMAMWTGTYDRTKDERNATFRMIANAVINIYVAEGARDPCVL